MEPSDHGLRSICRARSGGVGTHPGQRPPGAATPGGAVGSIMCAWVRAPSSPLPSVTSRPSSSLLRPLPVPLHSHSLPPPLNFHLSLQALLVPPPCVLQASLCALSMVPSCPLRAPAGSLAAWRGSLALLALSAGPIQTQTSWGPLCPSRRWRGRVDPRRHSLRVTSRDPCTGSWGLPQARDLRAGTLEALQSGPRGQRDRLPAQVVPRVYSNVLYFEGK